MTIAAAIMFAVAAVAGAAGVFLLARLRSRRSAEARYAHGIAGVMATALGLILALFAWVQYRWSVAP